LPIQSFVIWNARAQRDEKNPATGTKFISWLSEHSLTEGRQTSKAEASQKRKYS